LPRTSLAAGQLPPRPFLDQTGYPVIYLIPVLLHLEVWTEPDPEHFYRALRPASYNAVGGHGPALPRAEEQTYRFLGVYLCSCRPLIFCQYGANHVQVFGIRHHDGDIICISHDGCPEAKITRDALHSFQLPQ
ncbi:hypothetical protein Ahia01_000034000, partial [Argonauta hians]